MIMLHKRMFKRGLSFVNTNMLQGGGGGGGKTLKYWFLGMDWLQY